MSIFTARSGTRASCATTTRTPMLPSLMQTVRTLAALAWTVPLVVSLPRALAAQSPPIRLRLPGYFTPMSVDSVAMAPVTAQAPREITYKAANAVLTELKIPVTTQDPAFRVLGSGSARMMRKLGRERLSSYLNCGSGMSGSHADGWRVTMAIFVWFETVSPTETRIRVGMLAGAQDVEGVSKDPVACGSTGVFETQLAEMIQKRVAMF